MVPYDSFKSSLLVSYGFMRPPLFKEICIFSTDIYRANVSSGHVERGHSQRIITDQIVIDLLKLCET